MKGGRRRRPCGVVEYPTDATAGVRLLVRWFIRPTTFTPFTLSLILVVLPFVSSSSSPLLSLFCPDSDRVEDGCGFRRFACMQFLDVETVSPTRLWRRRTGDPTTATAEGKTERGGERAEFWGSEHRHLLPASFQASQPIPYIECGAVGCAMDIEAADGQRGERMKE